MLDTYSYKHHNTDRDRFPKINREVKKQESIIRYLRLKRLKESDLTLEDKLFLKNFKTAICILWGLITH